MEKSVPHKLFRPLDALVMTLVLSAGIFTLPWLWTGTGRRAEIRVEGKKVMRLELEGHARRATLPGFIGAVELEWGERGVRILRAPCPNQLCVNTGWVRRRDHRLVCAPSRLAVEIQGGDSHFDGVTF